jgi:dTDP-glucose 4,6-dehydratase
MSLLVTGGAGFIGSHFVREWIAQKGTLCINLDKLTYAGNLHNLEGLAQPALHQFVRGDIGDRSLVRRLLETHQPEAVIHLAAETHHERSIHEPATFVETNMWSAFALLDEVRHYWQRLEGARKGRFRFLNVSTDEVYGSLGPHDPPCKEDHPFAPNSPYAASKAAFDHQVHAFHVTYGLPTLTTHSANNFGPYQFPEKLVPHTIVNIGRGKPIALYGDGLQCRNWIYVKDHCEALRTVLEKGQPGASYNIGHKGDLTNLDLVTHICILIDALKTESPHRPHTRLITHIEDQRGHDRRYALDCHKIERELGWKPKHGFDESLLKTVIWYLDHETWVDNVTSGAYRTWVQA